MSQFKEEVIAVAKGWSRRASSRGPGRADVTHRYEWTLIDYAIWTAGAITVPVYDSGRASRMDPLRLGGGPASPDRLVETSSSASGTGCPGYRTYGRSTGPRLRRRGLDVGDEVITERATGRPTWPRSSTPGHYRASQGCELTHENLLSDVRNAFLAR